MLNQQGQVQSIRTKRPIRNKPLQRPDISRVQTLPESQPWAAESPCTPRYTGEFFLREVASPEVGTLCPQPRYAGVERPWESGESPSLPGSPGHDAAYHELRELLACSKTSIEQGRPLSSVSTSAGLTPSPDERVRSPYGFCGRAFENSPHASGAHQQTPSPGPSEAAKRTSPASKKVFVGGVPQEMNQETIFDIFNEVARVKKAWLQRIKPNGEMDRSIPYNHRGFGFVIFQDADAVDKLLGPNNFSKFVELKNGRKLEVKRAVSSVNMADEPVAGQAELETIPHQHRQLTEGLGSWSGTSPMPAPRPAFVGTTPQAVMMAATPWSGMRPAPLARTQEVCSNLHPSSCVIIPAAMQPSLPQWTRCTGLPIWSLPFPQPALANAVPAQANGGMNSAPVQVHGIVSSAPKALPLQRMHHSMADLEAALLQAMPDHYDE